MKVQSNNNKLGTILNVIISKMFYRRTEKNPILKEDRNVLSIV